MNKHSFLSEEERELGSQFLENGYVIVDVEDRDALNGLRDRITKLAAEKLDCPVPEQAEIYLNTIHRQLPFEQLNELRLYIIQQLNADSHSRQTYFYLARRALESLIGNELAMQRRLNLSIQMPDDDSSLLPIHTDVWSGDSPFEVVAWLPLVDCYRSKAMYLVGPEKNQSIREHFKEFQHASAEDLYQAVKDDSQFIHIPFGKMLLFSQTLMHGNRVNRENETRWSINVRFKSLLSPYSDKRIGEFFDPITLRVATRIGMNYRHFPSFNDE